MRFRLLTAEKPQYQYLRQKQVFAPNYSLQPHYVSTTCHSHTGRHMNPKRLTKTARNC